MGNFLDSSSSSGNRCDYIHDPEQVYMREIGSCGKPFSLKPHVTT